MAPRQIRTQELVELATEHSGLSPAEADEAVGAVVDAIDELVGESESVEFVTVPSKSVIVTTTRLDPAHPPKLDLQRAAIADEGMIGSSLFRRH